jgi:hypothetical protein
MESNTQAFKEQRRQIYLKEKEVLDENKKEADWEK